MQKFHLLTASAIAVAGTIMLTAVHVREVRAAHGVRDNAEKALAAEHATLAQILEAQRFETAAFVGSAVLDPDRGLDQGFNTYSGVSRTTLKGRTTSWTFPHPRWTV